ncbi:IS3 family transposase [Actinobacillus vicugnae]|uniref:IS3 family transposase n=1 Tax=Actinobacillus vicugnae TaxID=2573093 RepID=UPI003CC7CD91
MGDRCYGISRRARNALFFASNGFNQLRNKRIKSDLKGLSPIQYKAQYLVL